MITEDYCSYEVAKLLKEKGFDEPIWTRYEDDNEVIFGDKYDWNNSPMGQISAPTLQMAMKWLREKGIECVVIPIWNTIGKQYRSYVLSNLGDKYKDNYDSYSDNISYEQAVEAALKYCLENLI